MSPASFKRDDLVTLKTGSRYMWVESIDGEYVHCAWFVADEEYGHREEGTFKAGDLVPYIPPEEG